MVVFPFSKDSKQVWEGLGGFKATQTHTWTWDSQCLAFGGLKSAHSTLKIKETPSYGKMHLPSRVQINTREFHKPIKHFPYCCKDQQIMHSMYLQCKLNCVRDLFELDGYLVWAPGTFCYSRLLEKALKMLSLSMASCPQSTVFGEVWIEIPPQDFILNTKQSALLNEGKQEHWPASSLLSVDPRNSQTPVR